MNYIKFKEAKAKLIMSTRNNINKMGGNISDEKAIEIIEETLFSMKESSAFTGEEKFRLVNEAFYSLRCELGILTPFIKDEDIQEIMVNGPENVFIEKEGNIIKAPCRFENNEELEEVIRRIAAGVRREINEKSPILDARLADGSRVNAIYKNIALGGPSLNIRKFPQISMSMDNLLERGSITKEAAEFLKKITKAAYNIFVSGGTSSGKTTFLNALSEYIPGSERVVVIEDSAELQVSRLCNCVRLECRNANAEGKGEIAMETLIKTSLRMRPDRIIVGEVRGKECFAMLQALNTGHDGSMSTGHANSIEGMLKRLESMFLQAVEFPQDAICSQIAEGIDIVIHLGRIPDKGRVVLEIAEIIGYAEGKFIINSLFKYEINKGLRATGNKLSNVQKLILRGIDTDSGLQ
ncbi:MAG: CpaF family protein [Eubacteriales bacterium]|nr:CpaF family protein [Eubacteriales bacterium]MDD4389629.1 CpaF family protein [Eubacteriales bacterium]